ncbi:MAG TPA: heme-binding domain-containing protein [Candidatus Krumholzibacteria bacterium]|nr:heme-binding domain-containing protein [Candidatus Krumholzibacteria bacterium]
MAKRHLLRNVFLALVVLLVLAQFIRPDLSNPPAPDSNDMIHLVSPPPEVASMLQRSCYDCHSHRTRWPWYAHVAPPSWLVTHDVNEARHHMNFSLWGDYTQGAARHKLQEAQEQIHEGEMPLWYYLPLHPKARLSAAEKAAFQSWVDSLTANKE